LETSRPVLEAVLPPFESSPEALAEEAAIHRGNYATLFWHRAEVNVWMQTAGFILWAGPRAGGLMLIGMGLAKLGVLTGQRSPRFYLALALVGYGVGLPVVGYGAWNLMQHNFDVVYEFIVGGHFNYVGSLFVALGHVGLIVLACKAGVLPRLRSALAAVGRMSLSNYLLQTILCTTLFDGWGFGLFGSLDRIRLLGVVVLVWAVLLAWSPLWLSRFRYGPAEWVWRSLTYGEMQPMLRPVG
jgi:uncharacterized protein